MVLKKLDKLTTNFRSIHISLGLRKINIGHQINVKIHVADKNKTKHETFDATRHFIYLLIFCYMHFP